MKVVTGASGNVGSRLVPALLAHPGVTEVVGLARRPPQNSQIAWHQADVAKDDLRPLFRGADVVVHLAWLLVPSHEPALMESVNLDGTRAVLDALEDEDVPALVHASSLGAYSPGPKDRAVDEAYPTGGIASSLYSRHKATAERMLDEFELDHPDRRVVRIRAGFVLQAKAASSLARYFLGPLVPQSLIRPGLLPVVPRTALHARQLSVPQSALRAAVAAAWHLRLIPMDPGWVDLGLQAPADGHLSGTPRARLGAARRRARRTERGRCGHGCGARGPHPRSATSCLRCRAGGRGLPCGRGLRAPVSREQRTRGCWRLSGGGRLCPEQ